LTELDDLLRAVDVACDARDWDEVERLRVRARLAFERGHQLWPAADYAEYRLALEAPPQFAASVLTEDAGRFALGPLSEVAATHHSWRDLAPFAPSGPVAALTAHERVVRGEVVDAVPFASVLGVPLALAPWEPEYLVPIYRRDRVEEPGPDPIRGRALELPSARPSEFADVDVELAFRDLVRPWEGRVRYVAVHGDAAAALTALDVRDARGAWIDATEAMVWLAWAGATGGPNARRRGAAAGRDLAWAAAGALAGFESGERIEPSALGDAVAELGWLVWNAPDVSTGWILRIAVEDRVDDVAYAFDAVSTVASGAR